MVVKNKMQKQRKSAEKNENMNLERKQKVLEQAG